MFWKCLQNTAIYLVVTFIVQNTLGFIFAVILHSNVKLPTLFKCIIFIPTILAPATMAPVFRLLFSPQGLLQTVFDTLHLGITVDWLSKRTDVGDDLGVYRHEFHPVLRRHEPD